MFDGQPLSPITLEQTYCAHNYNPLPVVLTRGQGVYLWDDKGKRYLDMMSAYSAVSHGHCNPRLVKVAMEQMQTLNVTSRAYYSQWLGAFAHKACSLTGMARALPMNTGAEAVETAIKAARKWAYQIKGVPDQQAEIICCQGNFHGRTSGVISFSTEPQYRFGFGPLMPGVKTVPFGDADALERAITPNTAAFLVEPIQGEAGIVVPPPGYLARVAEICRARRVLLLCDEVQTGLGRTGKNFAFMHDHIQPDGLMLGKALGGGLLPVSLFLASEELMSVFTPGDHGSTFGGNPLAARIGLEALRILEEDQLAQRSAELGDYLLQQLKSFTHPAITDVRGKGLFIGVEIDPGYASARTLCERLMQRGVLTKDTHHTVIRLAPPLVIERSDLDWMLTQFKNCLN
ncbi:MAG TPA: ornithine--oxo-acid transaminase [Pseudomonadales bacterium]|nr:ornithine--oxo-acid transaminase [Pseudomonadales bacterium]